MAQAVEVPAFARLVLAAALVPLQLVALARQAQELAQQQALQRLAALLPSGRNFYRWLCGCDWSFHCRLNRRLLGRLC